MRPRYRFAWIAASVAVTAIACGDSTFSGEDGDGGGNDGAASSDGTTTGDGSMPSDGSAKFDAAIEATCTLAYDAGAPMIALPGILGCIDATEVTGADYQAFLTAIGNGYTPPNDRRCGFKTGDYKVDSNCMATRSADEQMPVTCIDWCDAFAYCEWAGKSLCGPIGGADGGVFGAVDPMGSMWERACTANGTLNFPYGSTYETGVCNVGSSAGAPSLEEVASRAACVGGYPQIYDMSGNASEWVDFCDEPDGSAVETNACALMGGSFATSNAGHPGRCNDFAPANRNAGAVDIGFRCCAQ